LRNFYFCHQACEPLSKTIIFTLLTWPLVRCFELCCHATNVVHVSVCQFIMHYSWKPQKLKQQSVTCRTSEVVPQTEGIRLQFWSNQHHIKDKSFISTSCNKLFSKILEILRNSWSGFSFRTREGRDANRQLSEALSSRLGSITQLWEEFKKNS
jgi:hypothetical protein